MGERVQPGFRLRMADDSEDDVFFVKQALTASGVSRFFRTEEWSYFRWLSPNPGLEELYDIKGDPREMVNRVTDTNCLSILQALRQRHDRYCIQLK